MNRLTAAVLLTLTLAGCSTTDGVSYSQIPGRINVVALDANGRLTYTPLRTDADRVDFGPMQAVQCDELPIPVC